MLEWPKCNQLAQKETTPEFSTKPGTKDIEWDCEQQVPQCHFFNPCKSSTLNLLRFHWSNFILSTRYVISHPLKDFYPPPQTICKGDPSVNWQLKGKQPIKRDKINPIDQKTIPISPNLTWTEQFYPV